MALLSQKDTVLYDGTNLSSNYQLPESRRPGNTDTEVTVFVSSSGIGSVCRRCRIVTRVKLLSISFLIHFARTVPLFCVAFTLTLHNPLLGRGCHIMPGKITVAQTFLSELRLDINTVWI